MSKPHLFDRNELGFTEAGMIAGLDVRNTRTFSDILQEWVDRCGSVDNFLAETDLDKAGITPVQVVRMITNRERAAVELGAYATEAQVAALSEAKLVPSLQLGNYLSALLPEELGIQPYIFRRRVSWAQDKSWESVKLRNDALATLRSARLKRIANASRAGEIHDSRERIVFQNWLDNKLQAFAEEYSIEEGINKQLFLEAACIQIANASDGHIRLTPEEILGTEPITHDLETKAEALASFLTIASGAEDHRQCVDLAMTAWETSKQKGDFPSLAHMLRFLRNSAGMTQTQLNERLQLQGSGIEAYEIALTPPPPFRLTEGDTSYKGLFKLSDEDASILLSQFPAAKIYSSTVPRYSEIISAIIDKNSDEPSVSQELGKGATPEALETLKITRFLRNSKLEGLVEPEEIQKLKDGAAPSIRLSNYLTYFAVEAGFKHEFYIISLRNARLGAKGVADAFSDASFLLARKAMLLDLAERKGATVLPDMLRFIRLTFGMGLQGFSSVLGMHSRNLSRLETRTVLLPQAEVLEKMANFAPEENVNLRLTPEEHFLLRHRAIDSYLSRSGERQKAGSYINQLPLLLGYGDKNTPVPDNSSNTPPEQRNLEQKNNARMLEFIRDDILRGYTIQDEPNPWPNILREIRANHGQMTQEKAVETYNSALEAAAANLRVPENLLSARRTTYKREWQKWESGKYRPNRTRQLILRSMFPFDIKKGMSSALDEIAEISSHAPEPRPEPESQPETESQPTHVQRLFARNAIVHGNWEAVGENAYSFTIPPEYVSAIQALLKRQQIVKDYSLEDNTLIMQKSDYERLRRNLINNSGCYK